MADLRIVDAPEIPTENITGEEKLPTGGNGNYSISLDSLAKYTKTKKDLADNTSVDSKVNGVRQELNNHIEDLLNPHQVTKGQIGLGNVDNTADADKPVSNSTQAAIISAVAPKADKTYVDSQLALKANKADVYTTSETYTKQESNDLVNSSISTALTPVNASLDLAKRGIANLYDPLLTYNSGERVVLTNGDIVKSTINGNVNDPNLNMAGWVKSNSASQIYDESGESQQEINTTLRTQANDFLNLKFNEISNSIKRSIGEIFYDLILDVAWFGAKADHDFRTGVGTVNDNAFQNCINFIGSLGSIRDGGKVKVKVPSGAYQLQHLDILTYLNIGFGLEFVGDGSNSTSLYFDESYTASEAITCNMQGVVFRDLAIHGSLTTIAVPVGRTKAIHAKNLTNDADIDITFIDCNAVAWNDFAHIYGRGFVWRGGLIAHTSRFLVVQNEVYNDSTPTKPNNIMRHYRIHGTRVDAVSLLMKVEGSNTSQQINNVNITVNDFYTLDRLIDFDGHTINGLVETGNNQLHSFATSMIRGTHLKNSVVTGAALLHRADASAIPTSDGECIGKVVDLLGDSIGNIISDNVIKNLRENIIHVRGAAIGNIISGNTLPECWSRSNTATDRVLCRFDGSVRTGNIIKDNATTSSVFSGTFRQTNIPLANLGDNIVKDNTSPWSWADSASLSSLSVYAGVVDITSAIAVNNRICRFIFDGDYIEGVLHLSVDTTETGAITVALPVPAVTELPTVTTILGGGGFILNILGFNAVGYVPSAVFVNAATDRFELYKLKDMARTALNWSDGTGTRTIYLSFRYRYK